MGSSGLAECVVGASPDGGVVLVRTGVLIGITPDTQENGEAVLAVT